MNPEQEIMTRLYEAYFLDGSHVNLHSIREELGIDNTAYWNIVDDMTHRGLIRQATLGGFYDIYTQGVLCTEENGFASEALIKENRNMRTNVLNQLSIIYEKSGSYTRTHIETLSHDLGMESLKLANNLQVLSDLDYVESLGMGSYKINYHGLEAVEEWREKVALVEEFEKISILDPQSRGRTLQKLLAKFIEKNGWSQEEGVRTSNEEMDVIFHKRHEYFLTECKWEKDPIEAPVVRELYGKLGNRAGVQGIIASMSGFTSGAEKQAVDYANERVFLFFGQKDINSLIYGNSSFDALIDEKYQQLITRRKILFS